jgi:hypothetical protein
MKPVTYNCKELYKIVNSYFLKNLSFFQQPMVFQEICAVLCILMGYEQKI